MCVTANGAAIRALDFWEGGATAAAVQGHTVVTNYILTPNIAIIILRHYRCDKDEPSYGG